MRGVPANYTLLFSGLPLYNEQLLGGVVTRGTVVNKSLQTLSLAAGVIALAGLAAWMGLAHGCQDPGGAGVVAGRVTISPELAAKVTPTDTLFIIVRRPQGPPRPIAVKRIDGPRFPVAFEITNEDVMIRGSGLSGMVNVIARLDRDGRAGRPEAGDMEGAYDKNPTLVGGRDINITINEQY